jgi:hypothetical protein
MADERESKPKLTVSQEFSVLQPRPQNAYLIAEADWKRIKRMVNEIVPPNNIYQQIGFTSLGVLGSSILALVSLKLSGASPPVWAWVVMWCVLITSLVVAAITLLLVDPGQKKTTVRTVESVVLEMTQIEQSCAPIAATEVRPAVQTIIQPPASPSASEALPGWKIIDNWEVRQEQVADWELGPDWIRGNQRGTVLWREHLPAVCEVRFDACLLQNNGGDEIDVIVGDSMALYYAEGVRLDYMTNEHDPIDFKRDRNKKLVQWEKPQVGKWYAFTVITTGEKATLTIDGRRVMDITWGPQTIFRGRLGFHHWNNKVEFKNLRVEKTR